jgi:hypothetical protein
MIGRSRGWGAWVDSPRRGGGCWCCHKAATPPTCGAGRSGGQEGEEGFKIRVALVVRGATAATPRRAPRRAAGMPGHFLYTAPRGSSTVCGCCCWRGERGLLLYELLQGGGGGGGGAAAAAATTTAVSRHSHRQHHWRVWLCCSVKTWAVYICFFGGALPARALLWMPCLPFFRGRSGDAQWQTKHDLILLLIN